MEDKLVTIAEYLVAEEAELDKQTLADAGIESIIAGSGPMNPFAGIPAVGDIQLQVLEHNAQKAKQIIEHQRHVEEQ